MQYGNRNDEKVLEQVRALLEQNRAQEACALLSTQGSRSSELSNAHAVCLMRMARFDKAVEVFRGFVLADNGLSLKPRLPEKYAVNFATALLLTGNLDGCLQTLEEAGEEARQGASDLYEAIARWKKSLPLGRRLWAAMGGMLPPGPIPLPFAPGTV